MKKLIGLASILLATHGCIPRTAPSIVEGSLINAYNIRWAPQRIQNLGQLDFREPVSNDFTIYNLPSSLCVIGLQLPPSNLIEYQFPIKSDVLGLKTQMRDDQQNVVASYDGDLSAWEMTRLINYGEGSQRRYSFVKSHTQGLSLNSPMLIHRPDEMVPSYEGNSTYFRRVEVYSFPGNGMHEKEPNDMLLFKTARERTYYLHIESVPLAGFCANGPQAKLFIILLPSRTECA